MKLFKWIMCVIMLVGFLIAQTMYKLDKFSIEQATYYCVVFGILALFFKEQEDK